MKQNVRKKILLLSVCALIIGALLLTGCRPTNTADDPWLDMWQKVVVDRSVEAEKVKVSVQYGMFSSQAEPQPQVTEDRDDIDGLLNALFAPTASFELVSGENITPLRGCYQFDFYIAGTDEIFSMQIILSESGNFIYHSLNDAEYLQCNTIKDYDALEDISDRILGH